MRVWRPRALQPLDDRLDRKFAHSLRFVFPRITAPERRSAETSAASFAAGRPANANDPAVVCIESPVSMLSLIRTGMPSSGPITRPPSRRLSMRSAVSCASGFSSITDRRVGPAQSIALIRSRYISVSRVTVSSPASICRRSCEMVAAARCWWGKLWSRVAMPSPSPAVADGRPDLAVDNGNRWPQNWIRFYRFQQAIHDFSVDWIP